MTSELNNRNISRNMAAGATDCGQVCADICVPCALTAGSVMEIGAWDS
jgi:hypothetical protein